MPIGIEDLRGVWKQLEMTALEMIFRTLIPLLLILQIALLPGQSFASRKVASVRTGPQKKSQRAQPSNKELMNSLREASLDAIGRVFLLYESPEELTDLVLSSMSPKDREEMRPLLMKEVVKLCPRINGDALELTGSQSKIVLRWPQFPAPTFNINGVDWTVSSHQSLKFNVDLLMKLQLRHGKKTSLWRFAVEEAQATFWGGVGLVVTGALLGEVIKTAKDIAMDQFCVAYYNVGERTRATCISTLEKLAKAKEFHEKLSGVKSEVAVKKINNSLKGLADTRKIWVPGRVRSCPTSKTQDVYVADVRLVKTQNGRAQLVGDWSTVRFELQPGTGKLKNGIIVPSGTDMNSADLIDAAKAYFEFDDNGLKVISVPNPQRDSLDVPPMVEISMAKDEGVLQPWAVSQKSQWVELVSQVNALIAGCIVAETQAKVNAQEGKPTTPVQQEEHPALPTGSGMKDSSPKEGAAPAPTVR